MKSEFIKELELLINKYSKENDSDTPDFILARYLNEVLKNFNAAVLDREQWYGRQVHLSDLPDDVEFPSQLPDDVPLPSVEQVPPIIYDGTGTPPPNIIDVSRTGDKPDEFPSITSES